MTRIRGRILTSYQIPPLEMTWCTRNNNRTYDDDRLHDYNHHNSYVPIHNHHHHHLLLLLLLPRIPIPPHPTLALRRQPASSSSSSSCFGESSVVVVVGERVCCCTTMTVGSWRGTSWVGSRLGRGGGGGGGGGGGRLGLFSLVFLLWEEGGGWIRSRGGGTLLLSLLSLSLLFFLGVGTVRRCQGYKERKPHTHTTKHTAHTHNNTTPHTGRNCREKEEDYTTGPGSLAPSDPSDHLTTNRFRNRAPLSSPPRVAVERRARAIHLRAPRFELLQVNPIQR